MQLYDLYERMFPDTGLFPNDSHMVGDAAYPLLTQLIVPYWDTGRLTHRQMKFNHALSQSQCVIEHACALLKGRFKRLKYLDMVRVDLVPRVIMACCVLHNLCIGQRDYLDDEDVEGPGDDGQQEVDESAEALSGTAGSSRLLAAAKRNEICSKVTSFHAGTILLNSTPAAIHQTFRQYCKLMKNLIS